MIASDMEELGVPRHLALALYSVEPEALDRILAGPRDSELDEAIRRLHAAPARHLAMQAREFAASVRGHKDEPRLRMLWIDKMQSAWRDAAGVRPWADMSLDDRETALLEELDNVRRERSRMNDEARANEIGGGDDEPG